MYLQTANLIIVSAVMPALATAVVCLRAMARFARKSESDSLITSDYLIFASLFFCYALSVTAICGAAIDRVGTPPVEQEPDEFTGYLKMMFAVQFLYISAVGLVKLSVLTFYRTIFPTKGFRLTCDIVSGVVVAWLIATLLGTLLRSTPISLNWNPTQPGGHHGNIVILFSFVGASDIFLDIFILALPLPVIRRLHMTTRRKWAVAGIFWLGGFCVVSSTVRLVYVVNFVAQYTGLGSYYSELVVSNLIWMIVEPSASIMAACLPTLGPLFKGGRSPGSMIRSIRSILSIRSQSSGNSSRSRKVSQEPSSPGDPCERPAAINGIHFNDYQASASADLHEHHDIQNQRRAPNSIAVYNKTDVTSSDRDLS